MSKNLDHLKAFFLVHRIFPVKLKIFSKEKLRWSSFPFMLTESTSALIPRIRRLLLLMVKTIRGNIVALKLRLFDSRIK